MQSLLFAAAVAEKTLGERAASLLLGLGFFGWLGFRYVWLPIKRPELVRAEMEREAENSKHRRAFAGKAGGVAARMIANRLMK
jgi:hypothetical protein